MTDDLTGLGPQGFERMCQALAMHALGPGIEVFGDGPDGGREVSFEGRLRYPSADQPWDGYGVLQAKYKTKLTGTRADTTWLYGQIKAELDAWTNPDRKRARNGRLPQYLIFATNVSLSAVPGSGGKDRVEELIRAYAERLGLKGWRVWDATQIATLLDRFPEVRRAFAALITPNEVLAAMHDRLTASVQANVVVTLPAAQIRPGQPGNEAAFQAAYIAAGGAARLGDAVGEVHQDGPGWVQPFDGGPTGEPAVLCALFGGPAVAVAGSVWDALVAVGGGAPSGGTGGVGFPVDPSGRCPFIGGDRDVVELAGGSWGRTKRARLVRRASGRWGWQPEIAFDADASRDRDAWTAQADKMDLRLRVAGRIPLVAEGLRITGTGRARMLAALRHAGMADIARTLAKRYGIDPGDVAWQETEEPDGDNNSRFAAYQASVVGVDGRQAMRACLWLALPDGHATELLSVVDLRIGFDAIGSGLMATAPAYIPAELRVTVAELMGFFTRAWHVATMVLPLAATEDPLDVPPAGAPRLELYIQNERPEMSGGDRTVRTLDMVDLSPFGSPRRSQIRDLAVAVTTPLGLSEQEIASLVKRAMIRMADDFGFTSADTTKL